MKIYMETYGCSANQADSEMIAGLLKREGHSIVGSPEDASVSIINTCAVKTPTSDRMAHRIGELSGKGKPLLVAGCMPEIERGRIRKISPGASMIGTNHLREIPKEIGKISRGKRIELLGKKGERKFCLPRDRINPVVGIVPVSSGCLGSCAYCCVRIAKGKLFSYPPEMILKDVESSLKEGCREIWITSQDNGCYGFDRGTSLPGLLGKMVQIERDFRVRVGMMNPDHVRKFLPDLIDIYKDSKIYKFIHLPVQSGSGRVLKSMNRRYSARDFEGIVKRFREEIPDVTLSTDIIVGFPGETEKDFIKTKGLLERVSPDIVNLSKFGARPGTPASKMEQVDNGVVKERSRKLGSVIKKITMERNTRFTGRECEILISERGTQKNQWSGRSESYKPVLVNSKRDLTGRLLKVKITGAEETHLIGSIQR